MRWLGVQVLSPAPQGLETPQACMARFRPCVPEIPRDSRSSRSISVGGFPSGQREQTVNLSAKPSEVRILPPPPRIPSGCAKLQSEHGAGIAQLVEHQPSKLRVASSNLVSRSSRLARELDKAGQSTGDGDFSFASGPKNAILCLVPARREHRGPRSSVGRALAW